MFSAFFWCAGEAIYSFCWNQAYLSFRIGQKPPVVSVRWDLIEPFGGFFCLICAFGKWGTLSICERCLDGPVAAEQTHPLQVTQRPPGFSRPLPHAGTAAPRLSPGGPAGKDHLSRWTQGWHEAPSWRGRRRLAGVHFAAELCELAGGCGNHSGHARPGGCRGSPQNSFVPAASPSRPFQSKQPCCPGFVFSRFASFLLQLSSSKQAANESNIQISARWILIDRY